MNRRSKLTLNIKYLVVFVGLLVAVSASGCMESKASAAEEINISFSLISSAESRFENVGSSIEAGTYTDAKTELRASRVDFEEALKILDNASSDSEEENQAIERYKILAESGLDRVNCSEYTITALEHLDKFAAHISSEDLDLSRKELDKTNEALNNSSAYLISAKEKIFSIDPDSVPVEEKSSIILLRSDLEVAEKMHLELQEMINGMYPYVDGFKHFINAGEYIDNEEWGKAADEFADSSVDFAESKKELENLRDSEYSEISVAVIEFYGLMTQMEEDLPHFEAGCRYMDQGRYSQAEEEFSKISTYYE